MPLAEPEHLQKLRKLRQTQKGETMPDLTRTPTLIGYYNDRIDAMRDVFTACIGAERHMQNEGMIRVLIEILTALHRQAEALESIDQRTAALAAHVASWLPSPKKGD
jgi:hypothetical protein